MRRTLKARSCWVGLQSRDLNYVCSVSMYLAAMSERRGGGGGGMNTEKSSAIFQNAISVLLRYHCLQGFDGEVPWSPLAVSLPLSLFSFPPLSLREISWRWKNGQWWHMWMQACSYLCGAFREINIWEHSVKWSSLNKSPWHNKHFWHMSTPPTHHPLVPSPLAHAHTRRAHTHTLVRSPLRHHLPLPASSCATKWCLPTGH